ncbi:MAG: Gfo/Idh/MocA family oxidoreductase [Kiritimatiellae bacterium]|nr:Gfo/Idh/MocA family oxidoreductase [Kiritimatiellia bacterium]
MAKVKIGILGLGRGLGHLRNALALKDAEVIGACDWYPARHERAGQILAQRGAEIALRKEFEELLALKPDAVVVASNGKIQAEHACRAMEAGCHVLSEVPGAYTVEEWIRIRDTVERTGKVYMLAENSCFLDFLRHWRKWVIEDQFGPISIAEAEYLHYLPATLELPDGSRLSPSQAKAQGRTDPRPIWRADQPPIQYLTHDLGPTLEVLEDCAVSVTCRSAPWWCKETPLRADGQIALFHTAKGTLVKILVTLSTRMPSGHRYRIMGTDGSAEWFSYEGFCRRLTRDQGHSEEKTAWERVDIGTAAPDADPTAGHGGTDLSMLAGFIRAIAEDAPPPIDVYRAIEFSLPGIIANKSAEQGGTPMSIPNLRRRPFERTRFWDFVGLP